MPRRRRGQSRWRWRVTPGCSSWQSTLARAAPPFGPRALGVGRRHRRPSPTAAAAAAAAAPAAAAAATSISPDAIVVGSGVAGMTAALRLLDRGAKVVLVDKEGKVGGNSAKASSGINGCCPAHSRSEANRHDTIEAFANDTARSAKREPDGLIGLLARKSAETLDWLRERTSIDLSRVAQLGGHSHAHAPAKQRDDRAELTFVLHRELKAYAKSGALSIRTGCRMTGFLLDDDDGSERAAEGGSRSGAGSDRRGSEGVGVRGIRYVVEKTGRSSSWPRRRPSLPPVATPTTTPTRRSSPSTDPTSSPTPPPTACGRRATA